MLGLDISAVAKLGLAAIDRLFPDPVEKAKQVLALTELQQKGDLAQLNAHVQLMLGQLEINKEEAKSGSLLVAGWRPAVGWIAAIGLGVAFIPKAIAITVLWSAQAYLTLKVCGADVACTITDYTLPPFPDLGMTDLIGILGAMLGMGTLRSFDKMQDTDTKRIGPVG